MTAEIPKHLNLPGVTTDDKMSSTLLLGQYQDQIEHGVNKHELVTLQAKSNYIAARRKYFRPNKLLTFRLDCLLTTWQYYQKIFHGCTQSLVNEKRLKCLTC
jgi:hypothetical protein